MHGAANPTTDQRRNPLPLQGGNAFRQGEVLETELTPFPLTVMLNGDDQDQETEVENWCNARSEYGYGECGHVI
jgi:hypothetical protein